MELHMIQGQQIAVFKDSENMGCCTPHAKPLECLLCPHFKGDQPTTSEGAENE